MWRKRAIRVGERAVKHGAQITSPGAAFCRRFTTGLAARLTLSTLGLPACRTILLGYCVKQLLAHNDHIWRRIDPQLHALALNRQHIDRNDPIEYDCFAYFTTQYEHPTLSLLWHPLPSTSLSADPNGPS